MKNNKVISTTALVLGGLIATTGTQTVAHAATQSEGTKEATTTAKVAATSQTTPKEQQASQAVTSYAASQATVASQAASQANTDTQSYADQLAKDPAKTKAQEQQEALDHKTAATSAADQALTDATNQASQTQSKAVAKAQTTKTKADQQAAATKNAAESKAKATKQAADAAALAAKQAADQQAAKTKDAQIKQAQAGKLDSKYATNVANAQAKLNADQEKVDQANAGTTTAYVATPTNNNDFSETGNHDIQSEKNLPTKITDPKLSSAQTNSKNSDDLVGFYGESLKNDNSDVITGELTASQQSELADYAMTLINSWRSAQGMKPIQWTKQAQDATVEIVKLRETSKIGMSHNFQNSSVMGQVRDIANNYGLSDSMENLSFLEAYHDKVTMTLLKVQILNTMTTMLYQDAQSNWGHKNTFTNAKYMGFGVQKNTDPATSGILSYVLVFDTFQDGDSNSLAGATPVAQTVLTPTSAQTIEALRNSGGATPAQLQVVANDKVALANAKKALADATNVVNQSIAGQLATINGNYSKQLKTNVATYQAKLAQNDTTYKQAIAKATKAYTTALTQNTAKQTAKVQAAKQAYDSAIAKATATHDAAIKQAQATFATEYANAHDETPAERDARHAKLLDAFKAAEADKLAQLSAQQASDLAAFKAQQAKLVAAALAKQAQAKDRADVVTVTNADKVKPAASVISLHHGTVSHPVNVVLPAKATAKSAQLPQTDERQAAPASLLGLVLLGLTSLGFGLLRRKAR